jgi:hypothetical protein
VSGADAAITPCPFSQPTFAETRGDEQDAPEAVVRHWNRRDDERRSPQNRAALGQSPEYFATMPVSRRNYSVDHTQAASMPSELQCGADCGARRKVLR